MADEGGQLPGVVARRHFHWALAAAMLPVVAVPLEWAVALTDRRSTDSTPEHRWWSRGLVGLAVVDSILGALVIALVASGVWGWPGVVERRTSGDAVRIGVSLVPNPARPDEAQIAGVDPDSPAERAGLRPGDVVVSLDGDPILDVNDLPNRIRSGAPRVPRTLRIRRAGDEAEVVVTPERRSAIRWAAEAPFTPRPTAPCLDEFTGYLEALTRWRGLWAGAFVMGTLWLAMRRLQPRPPALWSWVMVALGVEALVGAVGASAMCVALGGRVTEATLAVRLAQSSILLVVGLVIMRRMARAGLLAAGAARVLAAPRAVLLGFFYLAMFNVRLNVLVSAFEMFARVRTPAAGGGEALLSRFASVGWQGQVLIALTVAVQAPLAEELLFRGVVLPRLQLVTGAAGAIVASSVVFAALHEGFGGEPFGVRAAGVFVHALVLGWARFRTGGLAAPITIHVTINTLSLLTYR